jgi:hypothetical protein
MIDVPSIKNGTWYTSFHERIVPVRIRRIWVAVYVDRARTPNPLLQTTRRAAHQRSRRPTWPPPLGHRTGCHHPRIPSRNKQNKTREMALGKVAAAPASSNKARTRTNLNASIFLPSLSTVLQRALCSRGTPLLSLHPRSLLSVQTTTGRGEIIYSSGGGKSVASRARRSAGYTNAGDHPALLACLSVLCSVAEGLY